MEEPFILDLAENPHPKLLSLLRTQRDACLKSAAVNGRYSIAAITENAKYDFGLECCAAATGLTVLEMREWVSRAVPGDDQH